MKIYIDTPENIAIKSAQKYKELLAKKPNAVLGYATGSTPLGLYAQLVKLYKEGKISFKAVTTFNLDEYKGLTPDHSQSYRHFMEVNLFNHLDLPKDSIHVPSGINTEETDLAKYESDIANAGGVDLQLLGIGKNGHIGFNEPGTPFESLTHIVNLTKSTIEANARFFDKIEEVPTQAITMGIKTVMNAKSLLFIATGIDKAEAVRATLKGPVTPDMPASVIQLHPDVEVWLDEDAASLL